MTKACVWPTFKLATGGAIEGGPGVGVGTVGGSGVGVGAGGGAGSSNTVVVVMSVPATVAVTLERAGGATSPTLPILFRAEAT